MDVIFTFSIITGYLAGSISSAIIVCRLSGLPDPRTQGSKNAGATNVHRIGGRWLGFFTLFGDFLKTALPMVLVYKLDYGREASLWVGVMAVIGHCFPIYFSFRGGKGVASMMTVVSLVISSFAILIVGTWLLTAYTFGRSSVASLLTSIIIPLFGYHFRPELFVPLCALSAVVLIRHRSNIANLLSGTEPLIGKNRSSDPVG
ncbi:MAG: glycerol-3-phosphate 1-O-acyltransferase PlsY [Kangiellaceae bacterium]|nr:glycerol-3-phosphate 1-O-acyltransferase PlsY [Kangiellaceae bacterium]